MYYIISNFNKQMNTIKAKINACLINLALSPLKQMKIQNKIQLIYIQMQLNIQMNIVVPCTWGQHTIT